MDTTYQTPGPFCPYMPYSYGTYVVSPSPTPSLHSEPMFQFPLSPGRCAGPKGPLNTPKIQSLNTADTRRKSINTRIPTRVESTGMINLFQPGVGFSDQVSESGESVQSVQSFQGIQFSPCFQFTPFQLPKANITPFQHQPNDKPCQIKQFEIPTHHRQSNICDNTRNKLVYKITIDSLIKQEPSDQVSSETIKSSARKSLNINQVAFKKTVAPSESPPTESDIVNEQGDSSNPLGEKKGTMSMTKDVIKRDYRKKNSLIRKQRKMVQKKNKSLHKSELCTHWTLTSTCTFKGKCYFAHGVEELRNRSRVRNFKTQPCVDCPPEKARCIFGSRCNYCHPGEAIRRVVGAPYFDTDYYFALKMEYPSNDYPFGIFV